MAESYTDDPATASEVFWSERAATLGVFFSNGLGIGTWAASIAGLKAHLGLTDGQLSLALLSFACGAVITMPLSGWVGSRVSSGRATTTAGIAFAMVLAAPAFAPTLALLSCSAFILGASNGAVDVLMNAHASGVEKRWRAPIMSSFHAAFSLGGLAGALLGGALAAAGPLAALGAASTTGLVVMAAASAFLGKGAAAAPTPIAFPGRTLLTLSLLALLCMMIEGAVADWSGTLLAQSGSTISAAAIGYFAFSLFMVAGRLGGDWIVARLGAASIVSVGGAMAATGLSLVAFAPGAASGAVGFGLVGLGVSNVVPTVFSAAGRAGKNAAAGVAAAATVGYGGFLLGPVVIGTVATLSDLRWGMAVLALVAAAISVMAASRQLRS
jgi:MFS family permease